MATPKQPSEGREKFVPQEKAQTKPPDALQALKETMRSGKDSVRNIVRMLSDNGYQESDDEVPERKSEEKEGQEERVAVKNQSREARLDLALKIA